MSIASDNNLLWAPEHISDLLNVSVIWNADETTVQGMHVINSAAVGWLTGQMYTDTYFDLLAQYGINPYLFVREVEEHVELLIRST